MTRLLTILCSLLYVSHGIHFNFFNTTDELLHIIANRIHHNYTEVSSKCAVHMIQWAESLAALSAVAVQCKKSPMPVICEQLRRKILKQNKYAAIQLDAFGKIPENLAGFTKLSMGDYDECVEITSPLYKDYRALLAIVVGLAVFASVVDHYMQKNGEKYGLKKEPEGFMRYILCFSAVSNGRRIFAVPKSDKMVHGIDCIRFFSFTWVISGHFFGFLAMADNAYLLLNEMSKLYYHVWMNAYYSVDSFFLLSGTMLSYVFVGSSNKRSITKPGLWGLFYLHRYIRLTVPYAAYLLFYVVTLPHLNTGPNEIVGLEEIQSCGGVWWANMLYINNIYRRPQCLTISWYLASDTQMYVFSPLFLVPFIFSPQLGVLAVLVGLLLSIALTYYNVFTYDLPGLVIAMWAAAIAIALSALLSPYHYQRGVYWTRFQRATYFAFGRLGWSLSIGWLIIAINRGYGGKEM
ncbi:hypothetical protein ANCCAN_10929 [Ancylostoma caninum]|uniref:Acyltransferase 3 domain-containing protein n=1 Tax=Ancylostoma caninum TaxID=29170 RepID=A0A368GFE4_ANCCA|nr:hypothetical protein ANCCAN_10929 [Ancylostoma caninum]